MNPVASFFSIIERVPADLRSITSEDAGKSRDGGWSAAQELGHLLDSAIMNHTRAVRVLTEDNPNLPGYDGDFCVAAHSYATRDWHELVVLWEALNRHFLMAVEHISDENWKRPCVFGNRPVTLEFVFTDYIRHALHHLEHIGVDVTRFKPQMEAGA